MAYFAGVDCGTQSTKVVIVDTDTNKIIGEGSAPHQLISDNTGKREQLASWWTDALTIAFNKAISNAKIDGKQIKGIGISGQQHGFVPLNKSGEVIAPVKLWCDTSTAQENSYIVQKLGGVEACIEKFGIAIQTGYTASKILYLKEHHKDLYNQLGTIMLPHDYLNYYLTGNKCTEFGDASGSGLLNVKTKEYSQEIINVIDDSGILQSALLDLKSSQTIIGNVRADIARTLGVSESTVVSTGGGDNMMAAIGTGNIDNGIITMSLGTSGTLFTYSDQYIPMNEPQIASFCSSSNGYLPLVCTMNVTSATSLIQELLQSNLSELNEFLEKTPAGANGITMLPFFNGERVPALPNAKASLLYMDATNCTRANITKAAVEGATFGLRYAIDLLKAQGIGVNQIRLTGGGSKSKAWREIVANCTNAPIVALKNSEAASLGGAIQAMWACSTDGSKSALKDICENLVELDDSSFYKPDGKLVQEYESAYQRYFDALAKTYLQV